MELAELVTLYKKGNVEEKLFIIDLIRPTINAVILFVELFG